LNAQPRVRGGVGYSPSYINFYVANGGGGVPLYDDLCDKKARAILADAFPRREIVGVPAWVLARSDGAIHCITQQQPLAPFPNVTASPAASRQRVSLQGSGTCGRE
jgi:hypothetical protein